MLQELTPLGTKPRVLALPESAHDLPMPDTMPNSSQMFFCGCNLHLHTVCECKLRSVKKMRKC